MKNRFFGSSGKFEVSLLCKFEGAENHRVLRVFLLANSRFEYWFKIGSCPFSFRVLHHKFRAIFQYLGECHKL